MKYIDSGIYQIECLNNNKKYIGETTHFKSRSCEHLGLLGKGKHHNCDLQEDFSLFGNSSFEFTVLERLDAEKKVLLKREEYYINKLVNDGEVLYNFAHAAAPTEIVRDFSVSNPPGSVTLTKEEVEIIFQYRLSGAQIRAFIYVKCYGHTEKPKDTIEEVGLIRTSWYKIINALKKTPILDFLGE